MLAYFLRLVMELTGFYSLLLGTQGGARRRRRWWRWKGRRRSESVPLRAVHLSRHKWPGNPN